MLILFTSCGLCDSHYVNSIPFWFVCDSHYVNAVPILGLSDSHYVNSIPILGCMWIHTCADTHAHTHTTHTHLCESETSRTPSFKMLQNFKTFLKPIENFRLQRSGHFQLFRPQFLGNNRWVSALIDRCLP